MKEIESKPMKLSTIMDYIGEYLRKNDFVIVPREKAKSEKLKERYLRKHSLSLKEIADAKIWGDIGKQAVKHRVKKYLESGEILPHEIDKSKHTHRIRRQAYERIGKNYGTL